MRSPDDMPPPPTRPKLGRRGWMVVIAVLILILILSLKSLATVWTDQMWFVSIHQGSVWTQLFTVKVLLFAVFGALFFVMLYVNLLVTDWLGAKEPLTEPEDELVRRFQSVVHPIAGRVYAALALLLALAAAGGTVGQWQNWLLFANGSSVGVRDPQFGMDVGFYLFKLPFLEFAVGWFVVSLVAISIITVVFHYLNGGIRAQRAGERVRPPVKVHLSVLLALLALGKAAGYVLQKYQLVTARGVVEGVTYTDVHARIPALDLLFWLSLLAAVILLVNVRQRGWTLPVIAVGIWAFTALVVGVIYPALLQTLKVTPNQGTLELPYIKNNIAATRAAYNLNSINVSNIAGTNTLSPADLAAAGPSLSNTRLWDPDATIGLQTFQAVQSIKSYYTFQALGVDRYTVNGKLTPALVGVRQVTSDLQNPSWVNTHLIYTHGNGVALSLANATQANGYPTFSTKNVPPVSSGGVENISQPGVYFGLNDPGYVVGNTKQPELDYQEANGYTHYTHYSGTGGVPVGGLFSKLAFVLRLNDPNLFFNSEITPSSRIMFVRDVQVMAQKAAPFLSFDSQPYAAVVNGRIEWILDGYTTSDNYPYSQNADSSSIMTPSVSGLPFSYNYVRNSVKVVIDAYSGQMNFYIIDKKDPIIAAYARAFPHLFTSAPMPTDVVAHLRYPPDLFGAQAAVFGRYHITNPTGFYTAGQAWNISPSPLVGPLKTVESGTGIGPGGVGTTDATAERMPPTYQVNSLPGSSAQTFTGSEAFVPASQGQIKSLSAFMMVTSDPSNYGRINVYVAPSGGSVAGPELANSAMLTNTVVSPQLNFLNQQSSTVLLGSMLMIPVGDSILYVRPLYVTSTQTNLPLLRYVITYFNGHVGFRNSLTASLLDVLGPGVPSDGGNSGGGGGTVTPTIRALINQAVASVAQAQAALTKGDLGGYQSNMTQAGTYLREAQQLANQGSPKTATHATTLGGLTTTTTTTAPVHASVSQSATTSTSTSTTLPTPTTMAGTKRTLAVPTHR